MVNNDDDQIIPDNNTTKVPISNVKENGINKIGGNLEIPNLGVEQQEQKIERKSVEKKGNIESEFVKKVENLYQKFDSMINSFRQMVLLQWKNKEDKQIKNKIQAIKKKYNLPDKDLK